MAVLKVSELERVDCILKTKFPENAMRRKLTRIKSYYLVEFSQEKWVLIVNEIINLYVR